MKCPKCHSENPEGAQFCKNCSAPLMNQDNMKESNTKTFRTVVEDFKRGDVISGRYEIIEELGKGGMGKVYKAFDNKVDEKVALKLIKTEISSDKNTLKRFKNELKVTRQISHRNVCRMYDINEEQGASFITMEYVSGEDLKSLMRRIGQFTIGKAVFISRQVVEGMSEAHKLGVVHRDLKPQNIMIDREGNARIMDFGIARSIKGKGITDTGVMIGTPEYMSPEQAEVKDVDHRSDIYSFGVILYEMVTGRAPFEGDTPLGIVMKHKNEKPPDPKKFSPQLPDELKKLILKCLEKKKEKRYQSADELLAELTDIEESFPTTERLIPKKPKGTSREVSVQFKLRKILIPLVVITIAGFIIIAGWLFVLRDKTPEPTSPEKEKSAVSPQAEVVPIKDILAQGNENLENKNYSEAIERFNAILEKEPENTQALLGLAEVYKKQGKLDEAVSKYEQVSLLEETIPEPYKHLGEIFELKQEWAKSIFYFNKYLDAVPESVGIDDIEQKVSHLQEQLTYVEKPEEKEETVKVEEKTDEKPKIELEKTEPVPEPVKKSDDVSIKLKEGIDDFDKGNFQKCIEQMKEVLIMDPDNEKARKYMRSARLEMAPGEIKSLVNQYISSINNDELLLFYNNNCSPKLYNELKRDIKMISANYNKLQGNASQINIRFKGSNKAEVKFSHIITGISRKDDTRSVLFEGTYIWMIERQNSHWKIMSINSH
ncbi:MAG: protein kinase domain-containing protein [Candidatus Aminicenantaceae bacterium]